MRCNICENFSFSIICKKCQTNLLKPNFYKKELEKDFFVYSFYNYDEIKNLLNSKYYIFGDRIFNIIAKNSLKIFAKNFNYNEKIFIIPIDDHTRHHFSHTAILATALKTKNLIPIFNSLKAKNIVKYAGKSLEFRQKNKRNFLYSGKKNIKVIIVDDTITTGETILEAKKILEQNGCEVIFAITLAQGVIKKITSC
jgi:competence protein ComFC